MTLSARPATIPLPESSAFPPELVAAAHWVGYALEERDGELTKIPKDPRTGRNARSNDRATWSDFHTARAFAASRGLGVGLMLAPPLIGIDLDDCRDPQTDQLTPIATSVLGELETYAEVSVSRTGVKAIGYGVKPGTRCRRKGLKIEIYDHARLFALTGQRLPDAPLAVGDVHEAVSFIYGAAFGEERPAAPARGPLPVTDEDDAAILDWLREHGRGFSPLWQGTAGDDHSAADLALCNLLAWRTGDPVRVDRLFRASGLFRTKWDERRGDRTYGERTVAKAFAGRTRYYEPSAPRPLPLIAPAMTATSVDAPAVPDDPELAQYLSMSHEQLARRAYRAERFNRALVRFDKNRRIQTVKPTVRAALFLYGNAERAGTLPPDGWLPTSRAAIAEAGGVSIDAAGDHLRRVDGWEIGIRREVRDQDYIVIDAEGRTLVQKRPRLYVKVEGDVVDKLEELAVFTPPQEEGKAGHGGKRDTCAACGSQNTHREVRVVCDDCGHTSKPISVDNGMISPVPAAPTPAALAPEATYPSPIPIAADCPAGPEEDDRDGWDPFGCNYPGCTAPLKLGQRYCDFHREKPLARRRFGSPEISEQLALGRPPGGDAGEDTVSVEEVRAATAATLAAEARRTLATIRAQLPAIAPGGFYEVHTGLGFPSGTPVATIDASPRQVTVRTAGGDELRLPAGPLESAGEVLVAGRRFARGAHLATLLRQAEARLAATVGGGP